MEEIWIESAYINKKGITQVVHAEDYSLAPTPETHLASLLESSISDSGTESNGEIQENSDIRFSMKDSDGNDLAAEQ